MLYHIAFTADDSARPLVWDRQTRKTAAQIIKDVLTQNGSIRISICDAPRHFIVYNPYGDDWLIFRHGNSRSLYTGRSYKTLSGALSKLDRLAESEARV